MKTRYVCLLLLLSLVLGVYAVFRVQNYYEARSFDLRVKVRTPVYERSRYPYATQSPLNTIVGYLEVGSTPDVRGMTYDKPWPYWEVRLESGGTGYLFAPDVEISRKGAP
jgi:hypothetical protein